jgi:hypothetical protein
MVRLQLADTCHPCTREASEPESSPDSPLQPFPGRPGGSSDARPDGLEPLIRR